MSEFDQTSSKPHTESESPAEASQTAGADRNGSSTVTARSESSSKASQGEPVRLGLVSYDSTRVDNTTVTVVVADTRWRHFRRDVYVGINDEAQGLEFLGRIVAGPFHRVRPKSGPADKDTAPQRDARTRYDITGTVEILGQVLEGERVVSTPTRPRPFSELYIFPDHRLREYLGTGGDFHIGHLVGHKELQVAAKSESKNFLPRNVGVFGTVGSGKSNTAQVLIEEAAQAGWAVVVVDVEGEYVRMNEPTTDPRLVTILTEDYGLEPRGVDDLRVYHPTSGTSDAADPISFKVPMSALDPDIVSDILELSEPEFRVFGKATKQASLYAPAPSYPGEIVRAFSLQNLLDGLMEVRGASGNAVRLLPLANADDVLTAGIVRSKLHHLASSNVLDWNDTEDVPELPIDELLEPGRLSVLDVSETDDRSRNLAIAYVLQALFEKVIETPRGEPMASGKPRPPVLVVIEEVHTFVSRAAASKMKALLDNLQVISRRGRKRWMALTLVSQQPNHVPDEMFELANTRFIHQIKSSTNLEPVKQTTGAVDENLWSHVPAMEPGRCLLAGAVFKNPLFIDVKPARSRRLLVG